jgi:hypothetical protein
VHEVCTSTQQPKYRAPMKVGDRVVTDALLLDVEVDIRDGRRGRDSGSMPMSDTLAWPIGVRVYSILIMPDR